MHKILIGALVALAACSVLAWAENGSIDVASLAEECAGCHGEGGASEVSDFPVIGGQTYDYLWQALRNYKDGVRTDDMMQSFAEMRSYEELKALAGFYAEQPWKNTEAGYEEDLVKAGKKLTGDCARCHKTDGTGMGTIPRLAGQHAAYLETALNRYKDGERGLNVMTQFSQNYKTEDFPALANFYAALPELNK